MIKGGNTNKMLFMQSGQSLLLCLIPPLPQRNKTTKKYVRRNNRIKAWESKADDLDSKEISLITVSHRRSPIQCWKRIRDSAGGLFFILISGLSHAPSPLLDNNLPLRHNDSELSMQLISTNAFDCLPFSRKLYLPDYTCIIFQYCSSREWKTDNDCSGNTASY